MNIGLNIELMLLVFCLFILCIFLLNQWLYKPILNFMDARDKMIKDDLESSNNNEIEITEIKNKIDSILENAKKEAATIKEQAQLQAKDKYNKNIEEIKSNNEKEFVSFIDSLKEEKEELKKALLLQMPDFKNSLNAKLKQMSK